ncbi:MAG: Rieske (2Fe-2S) protein [Dehalococcoidia bacterium]
MERRLIQKVISMAEFVTVAQTSDVPEGEMLLVELDDEGIAIANVEGNYYAFSAECTHAGGPLDEGDLDGETLTCPWHGGQYDVKTGRVIGPPPQEDIPTYQVKVEGTDIKIAR